MPEDDGNRRCGKMLLVRLVEVPVSNYDGGQMMSALVKVVAVKVMPMLL